MLSEALFNYHQCMNTPKWEDIKQCQNIQFETIKSCLSSNCLSFRLVSGWNGQPIYQHQVTELNVCCRSLAEILGIFRRGLKISWKTSWDALPATMRSNPSSKWFYHTSSKLANNLVRDARSIYVYIYIYMFIHILCVCVYIYICSIYDWD